MNNQRKIIIETMDNIAYLAFFYGIAAIPIFLAYENPADLWRLALIALPFWGCFFLRRLIKNFWLSLLVHFLFPVLAFFIVPGLIPAVVAVATVFAMVIFSLNHYFTRDTTTGNGFILIAGTFYSIVSIWAFFTGHLPLAAVYPPLVIITAVMRIVVIRMQQMDKSLEAIRLSSEQPVMRIVSFDYKLVAGLIAVIIALTLIIYFAVTGPVLEFIAERVRGIEFAEITPGEEDPALLEQSPMMPTGADGMDFLDLGDYRVLPAWVNLLTTILFSAIAAATFCFLVFAIIRSIIKRLSERIITNELADGTAEDEKEFIFPQMKKRAGKRGKHDNENPVRRLFRETMTAQIKKGVPIREHDTPTDMAARVKSEDLNELAEKYAGVRYRT